MVFQDEPVDRAMASRLLHFLVSNCYHESRMVLRNNLQVLKTLVEVWKNRFDIPYGYVNYTKAKDWDFLDTRVNVLIDFLEISY